MSRDTPNNLRLLGSPVNLTYRGKKRDDKKQIRNRPKSALNSSSFHMENPDRYKRPFSADAKGNHPVTRSFLNSFSADLQHSYNETANTLKIYPPRTDLLENEEKYEPQTVIADKEICSNASDFGSEDTFMSLGTKIKAKAQLTPKSKNSNKNMAKYKAMRKQRKNEHEEKPVSSDYNFDVKITEKPDKNIYQPRSLSPSLKNRAYDSYFIHFDATKEKEDSLAGRVSFGSGPSNNDIEKAIDSYSKRLNQTKQQLSLVEEENTQDIDSLPSQNLSSLSPEISIDENKTNKPSLNKDKETNDEESDKDSNFKVNTILITGPTTYPSFYDDFQPYGISNYEAKLSNTHTDSSSKDSGYIDEKVNSRKKSNSVCNTSTKVIERTNSNEKVLKEQPKSLDSIPLSVKKEDFKVSSEWPEPINHSRLLFKDFFLQKEGYRAIPQNSPVEKDKPPIKEVTKDHGNNEKEEYPTYLLNSNTKAYTSQVIEDYKKEIAAINNLHELTIKDIKTDAISPTPLHIDKMFETDDKPTSSIKEHYSSSKNNIPFQSCTSPTEMKSSTSIEKHENTNDVTKKSTKELIDDYFKVKEDYMKDSLIKPKKRDRNVHSAFGMYQSTQDNKKILNNKGIIKSTPPKLTLPLQLKNQIPKSCLKTPLSARLESVQHDKDIDSWMSLSEPLPKTTDYEDITEPSKDIDNTFSKDTSRDEKEPDDKIACSSPLLSARGSKSPSKELNPNATVLDIYSMLKEIESYGDGPVTGVTDIGETVPVVNEVSSDEKILGPKDHFVEIFEFLEKVEQSANDALSVVTTALPPNIPKLEQLLKLPQTELAQRLVTASLQLEERSCCIALLQESLTNHKEQMVQKVSNLEKQSQRNIHRVKQECEEAIKRHQSFIDQLINDKKTLNHRIEQLVDERRSLEERWRRSATTLEERYKLELKNQHDKMAAAQQVARQRWVRQKAEKIKELTVKGLEGELREMAERQQQEVSDLKMSHAEYVGRLQAKHQREIEETRAAMEKEKEEALVKERTMAANRLEKQILELELTYQEQRTRLIAEMRAENERVANGLTEREQTQRKELEKWKDEQEKLLDEKRAKMQQEIAKEREKLEEELTKRRAQIEEQFESHKREFEAEQQVILKRKVTEIATQHKIERDREIEKAIESLEAEAQQGRKELQDAMRRNKEQYECELKELAETEQATLRRYQEAQARVRQTEDRCAELEVSISQLETRNRILVEKNTQLERSSHEIRTSCNEAWASKVDKMKKDMEELKKTHEEQMHQLYAKVKIAVARKDSAIQALTRESSKQQEKITLLEQKLQQQRKDFLKQK